MMLRHTLLLDISLDTSHFTPRNAVVLPPMAFGGWKRIAAVQALVADIRTAKRVRSR